MPSFLKSRALQVADHLRAGLRERRLAEPLPGLRQWSRQLGVSRETLGLALARLEKEGWLTVAKRGVRLKPAPARRRKSKFRSDRLVRYILFGPYHREVDLQFERIGVLWEHLRRHDIELRWERCFPAQLQRIAAAPERPDEMIILGSVPPAYQAHFHGRSASTLVLGESEPDSPLSFVGVDQAGTVRHATLSLLRHGFGGLTLLHADFDTVALQRSVSYFQAACREWPQQPIDAQAVATAITFPGLHGTVRHLAEELGGRRGLIVLGPVPIGLVVTCLLQHGIRVPEQVEAMALFHSKDAAKLYPAPTHYPFPLEAVSHIMANAALKYFQSGRIPRLKKFVTVEAKGTAR